jgi:hypothetical protein
VTLDEYWGAVKAMGLRGAHRGSPDLDFLCTSRDGQLQQVADPERLDPDDREAVIRRLRARFGYDN